MDKVWYPVHVYNQVRKIVISFTSNIYHFFVLGTFKFFQPAFWNIELFLSIMVILLAVEHYKILFEPNCTLYPLTILSLCHTSSVYFSWPLAAKPFFYALLLWDKFLAFPNLKNRWYLFFLQYFLNIMMIS